MHAHSKAEQVNIRASALQKARLAEAARLRNMNVSQFMLTTSLEAADDIIADQMLIHLSAEAYDRFVQCLEEEPTDLPKLRELFSRPSVLES